MGETPRDSEELPLHVTSRRIVSQFDTMVPQIHLTFVSVLQGLALAVFVGSLRPPSFGSWQSFVGTLFDSHFYLPFLGSFLLIVIVWDAFAYDVFFIHWPLNSRSTILVLVFTLTELGACTSGANVGIWTFWMGATGVTAGLIFLRNRRIVSSNLYALPSGKRSVYQQERTKLRPVLAYFVIGVLCPIGLLKALNVPPLDVAVRLGARTVQVVDYALPLLVLVIAVVLIQSHDSLFTRYTRQILEAYHSPYTIGKGGILDERGKAPDKP